jgi:hypothetical protein
MKIQCLILLRQKTVLFTNPASITTSIKFVWGSFPVTITLLKRNKSKMFQYVLGTEIKTNRQVFCQVFCQVFTYTKLTTVA